MKHLRHILLILLGLFLLPEANAQTDSSLTQTICFGSVKNYRVDWNGSNPLTGTPGSTYAWSVTTPGFTGSITPTSASGNSVSINWGTTPAAVPSGTTYTLQVVETNGGCTAPAITMNVTVIPLPTVTVGANQSICQNTISTGLGGVIGGSATGASWTSDVAGGTFTPNASTLNATWTPPAGYTGIANLTLATTGMAPCTAAVASMQVNVTSANSIALSSAVGTNSQTLCVNNAITNITYSVIGAAGATFSGLPAGVVGNFNAGVVTISGTPTTAVSSPFNYTITLTGGCGTVTAPGTITVTPIGTISLTSAAGTNNQTVCNNTAITNITYATTGATGATIAGLPAGVTGNYSAGIITISGTPSSVGSNSYAITLTGGCGTVTANGTITVTPNGTISLTSAAATNNQTVCNNTAITNITYATTGATGATITGLPAGVIGNYSAGIVTISGTPSSAVGSPFTYTITLTGGCGTGTTNGTITVTPVGSISLTSAAGTNNQTVCNNTAITNITYATTDATGATITGLPTGVSGNYNAGVVTISGTPSSTVGSPFSYTITLTGGCGIVNAIGTITVTPIGTITLTSAVATNNQTVCNNTAITNITYSSTSATGATFSGLPTGVSGNYNAGVVTISGTPSITTGSPFNYTITLTGGCGTVTATGTITVNPIPTIVAAAPVCSADLLTWSVGVTVSAGAVTSPVGTVVNTSGNNWTISGIPIATTSITLTSTASGCQGTLSVTAPNCLCPTITAPVAANASYCIGSPIPALTVTNGPAAGFTLNWYDAAVGGNLVGNGTPFTPTSAGTYYAQFVNDLTLCSSQRTAVTVTQNALPIVNAIGATTICEGSTATLTASNALTYTWSPSTGLSSTTGTTVIATPTSTQTYTVIGIDTNGCISTNNASVTVTVTPTPSTSPIFHD